jgi:YD repeat-containing protein
MLTGQGWTATTDASGASKFSGIKTGSTYATGWSYNANSLNTSVVETVDGVETQRWTLAYQADGDLRSITDVTAGNAVATIVNDAHGRPIRGTTDQGVAIAVTYNARGAITKMSRGGQASTFTYNPAGSLVQVRMPGNQVLDYVLDADQSIIDMKLNGVSITPQMLARADYPDTVFKAHMAVARQWLAKGVERLMRPAQAQGAAMGGLLRPPIPPVFDPRNDMLMSPMSRRDRVIRRTEEDKARNCRCDPNKGFSKPTFTDVTYAHVLWGGHMTPMFSDQSYFAPSETVKQSLVDEVIAKHSRKKTNPNGSREIYWANLQRTVGKTYDRLSTSSEKLVDTQWVRLVVETSNCSSLWRANEVVTLFPDLPPP